MTRAIAYDTERNVLIWKNDTDNPAGNTLFYQGFDYLTDTVITPTVSTNNQGWSSDVTRAIIYACFRPMALTRIRTAWRTSPMLTTTMMAFPIVLKVMEQLTQTAMACVSDSSDLDSDNDGINDVIEAGGTDADADGQIDNPATNQGTLTNPTNSDTDGQADYIDLDSDNDTISNLVEGGSGATDADDDGVADGPDRDGDGIADSADDLNGFGDATGPALPDKDSGADNDGAPDYADTDDSAGGAQDIDSTDQQRARHQRRRDARRRRHQRRHRCRQ